ncbi:hypothetical protein TRFO_16304 [Tritrichomonas foetus]|uniref:Uncharacterized protein n=1 Tax=Tritrichomonas foetus TaxID=1144522 RepID=A0A1J4KQD2_9EUKA|nr:hypothetical protein TRFO_16304 [Tritrichomonas foetus]|eukprot:OHT13451.1 hypothetical protein TRFO_16304 [Tritrichomonas foetus]
MFCEEILLYLTFSMNLKFQKNNRRMFSPNKEELIKEIRDLESEQQQLHSKIVLLNSRKDDLFEISSILKSNIANKCNQQIEWLSNEKTYISQRSIEDEEKIKKEFDERLKELTKEKCDLERKLEAESEFVARCLKDRLLKSYNRTLELRSKLFEKSEDILTNLNDETPSDNKTNGNKSNDEKEKKIKIAQNQQAAYNLAKKIAEAHREIEGYYAKNARLQKILAELRSRQKEKSFFENHPAFTQRRNSCFQ